MSVVANRTGLARAVPAVATAAALLLSACGVDPDVVSLSATPTGTDAPSESAEPQNDPAPTTSTPSAETTAPQPTNSPSTVPGSTLPSVVEPELNVVIPLDNVVDIDGSKPVRDYDAFLAVALTDIDQWWALTYPDVYGEPYVPLEGGIYAGYPERETELPGCGEPTTDYEDLRLFVAFYCEFGDFMVYDDDNQEVLAPLAAEYGPAVMGIVLAHEYGHAIQGRSGALGRRLSTIVTEQQADCFAGAWTGQAYRGESDLLRLGDADVRAGLIAMLNVRDPVGTSQFTPGGHGSAFDRVGAFQVGFTDGATRCSELLDDPLTLVPNQFQPGTLDQILGGNAPYDCEELRDIGGTDADVANCTPAPEFLADDLNDFWTTATGAEFPVLQVVPTDDLGSIVCADRSVLADEVIVCLETGTVAYHEPTVVELYREFGDFTLGYFYGVAWAEVAQLVLSSSLVAEQRALLNDCFTGAWVRDITPDAGGRTARGTDTDGDGFQDTGISSSPGDLDEAIQMAILKGDNGANVDAVGTAFDKIAAIRVGALGGLSACQAELG